MNRMSSAAVLLILLASFAGRLGADNRLPGEPCSFSLRPEQTSIRVNWSPPCNSNARVDRYVIGYGIRVADVAQTSVGWNTREYVIRNLVPDTEYVVSLRASNRIGYGKAVYKTVFTLPPRTSNPRPGQACRGDSPYVRINGQTCNQLVSGARSFCYNPTVAVKCCATCNRARSRANPQCPFGDRVTGCGGMTYDQCRIPSNNEQCCRTCGNVRPYCEDRTGLIFDNRYRGCAAYIRAKGVGKCYTTQMKNYCCRTCQANRIRGAEVGCEFGDNPGYSFTELDTGRKFYCEDLSYNGSVRRGDHCVNAKVKKHCCYTCRGYTATHK